MYSTTIFFFIIAGWAVRCDDSGNYFVVQMPDEVTHKQTPVKKALQVYWNVPTIQCQSKRIPFDKLQEKYGIIQNKHDTFRGDRVSIMYDPGFFPAIFKNASTGELILRNGGVPQEGDLELHMQQFRKDVEHQIEDPNFDGVGIIDFESWRPIFRQNFGALEPYQRLSCDIERRKHWWWPNEWITAEATKRFEEAAREFMQNTISIAKQMRPRALWGYYGFPYCFNNPPHVGACAKTVPVENDRLYWMWSESTALFPSIYSPSSLTAPKLSAFIKARVTEAARVARGTTPVLPYWWFRYRDAGFFSQTDLNMALQTLYRSSASGLVIWGSSADVNTPDKCHELLKYMETILGPSIAKYARPDSTIDVLNDLEFFIEDDNMTLPVTSKPLGMENVTESSHLVTVLNNISTVTIGSNADDVEDAVKITTRSNFTTNSIDILTSTTEMGAYASDISNETETIEDLRTISPILRILSTISDKDYTTNIPPEDTVFTKVFSERDEDLSTTSALDHTTQVTTLIIEEYEESNEEEFEIDEIFFNEEDFFDNSDVFSIADDISTSTVHSTTYISTIQTEPKSQSTQDMENENIYRSTTDSQVILDEGEKGLLEINAVKNNNYKNEFQTTEDTFESSTGSFNAKEATTDLTLDTEGKEDHTTIENVSNGLKAYKIDYTFDKEPDHILSTIATEKTQIIKDWRKSLLNEEEESNDTYEDNETVLKGDPTSMGLTSGNEKVHI